MSNTPAAFDRLLPKLPPRWLQLLSSLSMILIFMLSALALRQPAAAVTGIPQGAVVTSARFSIYVIDTGTYTVRVHRVTADWAEAVVTLNNFGDAYDPLVLASFVPRNLGWYSVDITGLAQSWIDGAAPNFGILIEQGDVGLAGYNSSDFATDPALRPKLEICYTHSSGNACVTIQRPGAAAEDVFDSYVWAYFPNNNYGTEPNLFTGRVNMAIKYSMLKFDFMVIQQQQAAIGDFVWLDKDADGIQDGDETGIQGVQVELYTCDGAFVASALTGPDGAYLFSNLPPGSYAVKFITPGGYFISPLNQGGDPGLDSDADPLTGMAVCTTLDPEETDLSWDAGLFRKAAIGDFVWLDKDADGIQDGDEAGIPDIPVALYTCDGAFIASTFTGPNGAYLFSGLIPGSYYVQFSANGYLISPLNQGGDPGLDSDADPLTGRSVCTTLDSGETDLSWDAGLFRKAAIGDFVWLDKDADGIQDGDEAGIPDIPVALYTCDGAFIASTFTGPNGAYLFSGLIPGSYYVQFSANGYLISPLNQGSDPGLDSDADPLTGRSVCTTLDSGETDLSWDAGLYKVYSLGDRVWYDQNRNGIQDPNEPGYNNATVSLFGNPTCTGAPMASTVTGATGPAGFYQFTGLLAGDYCVQFGNIPFGWSISPADQGNGANDSSANSSAQIPNIHLTADDPNEDMGIYVRGSLGDNVVCVSTGQNLPNITVTLYKDFNGDGQADGPSIGTTQTNASGFYQFTDLEVALAGDPNNLTKYLVVVDTTDPDLGACNVPIPPTSYNPPLDSNHPNDPNNDFRFEKPQCLVTLGDRVWYDANLNGLQDNGESGIDGVMLKLLDANGNPVLDANGNPLTAMTAGGGLYQFVVPCGAYQIQAVLPDGKTLTLVSVGPDRSVDSNPNPSAAPTTPLPNGGQDLSIDFGLVNFQDQCPPDGTTGLPSPVGTLYWGVDANGDVYVRYDQSRGLNDNSYGVNIVQWPRDHKFGDLVGSDKAQFKFTNASGSLALDILIDTISTQAGTPSGYASLGVTGGEGRVNTGQAAWVLAADTSIAKNLNNLGFCTGGNCSGAGTNLLLDSPPTVSSSSYDLPAGSPYVGWNFTNSYEMKISAAAFGLSGFGGVSVGEVHNSPPKVGSNAVIPVVCEPGPIACSIAAGAVTVRDKKIEWPLTNNGSEKITLAGLTLNWPQANGKLLKVKFDGDVIWDKKANWSPAGITLTSADFTTDSKKKSIDPGRTRKFTLEFEKNAVTDLAQYSGILEFGNGCVLNFPPGSGPGCSGVIGNFVWNDQDADGSQDSGEPGIAGATVTLKLNGAVKDTKTTDANGFYEFTGLCAGSYTVEVTTPPGFAPTPICSADQTIGTDSNCSPAPVSLPADNSSNLTIDFGFTASTPGGGTLMCPATPIPGYTGPIGVLYVTVESNGDITVRYDQSLSPGLNDNTYGTNIVQWPRDHRFGDLTGSDKAQFIFYDRNNVRVLDFTLDYLSTKSGTPSGYASLGPDGGDGRMNAGNRAFILSWDTSLAQNLNLTGFCTGGSCLFGGVNLLLNSPPTVSSSSYTLPAGSPFGAWNFANSYTVRISASAFGAAGFGRVDLGEVHNSPPKAGSNAVIPVPCVP